MKSLMKDPTYLKDLETFFGSADMKKELGKILQSTDMRKEMEKVVEETIQSPLLQTKWQKLSRGSRFTATGWRWFIFWWRWWFVTG